MLLIGCFAPVPAQAQAQNLEAGKSPSQIFAGTCSACHKSPRGLLKAVPAGSLPGFLRQHYTTSSDMASLLSAFLISNGATDTRYVGSQPKQEKDAKSEAKPAAAPEQLDRHGHRLHAAVPAQEAVRPESQPERTAEPDGEELPPQAEPGRRGRNAKRLARPAEAPDATKPAAEGQAASERGPDGRKSGTKQRLSKRGKPGSEELPKTDSAKDEPTKGEPAREDKSRSDTAKYEGKPEGDKLPGEVKSEAAKSEAAKSEAAKSEAARIEAQKPTGSGETTALRADPVPPVTPAPQGSSTVPPAISGGTSEPSAGASTSGAPSSGPPPAMTASMPHPAPAAPPGPPAPPISQ
jgi:hypothetical protein